MHYEGNIIRPPSEADSLILQVTVGCSHNKCSFCPTYKDTRFRLKEQDIVDADIEEARAYYGDHVRRVFITDGDALILKTDYLIALFDKLKTAFPKLTRIGLYGNVKSIFRKSPEELVRLREHGLGILYLGIESGNDRLRTEMKKGSTAAEAIEAGKRVKDAGIKLSVTVLLGIGGTEHWEDHAIDTGKLLTEMAPDYAGALTVIVVPGTPLYDEMRAGKFSVPDPLGILRELKVMLQNTAMPSGLFMANHASNYLPLKLRMPRDRDTAIKLIDEVLAKKDLTALRPESMRAL